MTTFLIVYIIYFLMICGCVFLVMLINEEKKKSINFNKCNKQIILKNIASSTSNIPIVTNRLIINKYNRAMN